MAMYRFGLESFHAVACRSAAGLDDVWVVMAVAVSGDKGRISFGQIGGGVVAGAGFTGSGGAGLWGGGPYQIPAGRTGAVAYALVNLAGMDAGAQGAQAAGLGTKILDAVEASLAGGAGAEAAGGLPQAVRDVFGAAGELVGAPGLAAGLADCRGLLGVYVEALPTDKDEPESTELETTDPVTMTAAAPATCGAGAQGTGPQSTAVFSMRRGPNLFSQSTPLTVLASAPDVTEIFAVGLDGLVRYSVRSGAGSFEGWQVAGVRRFSQSAPLVAMAGIPPRKDVFGTGADGVIYRWPWTQAEGWGDWTAVSTLGQFLPDTPVSAISLNGVLSLFAVNPDGVAQCMAWDGDAVKDAWAPLPGGVFARRTPLLVMSHVETWVEVFAVSKRGDDYHTSRANRGATAWGQWQMVQAASDGMEPSSRKMCGLTLDIFSAQKVSMGVGMAWFRVDANGHLSQSRWIPGTGTDTGWLPRFTLSLVQTISAGPVSGARIGNELVLFVVSSGGTHINVTYFGMPVPFNPDSGWGVTSLPAGPVLAADREITAVRADDSHVDVFVVDRHGLVQHFPWSNTLAGGAWSVV